MFGELELARKITVSSERRLYFHGKLEECDFGYRAMEYAECWLLFGDWSLKGSDATLTLDDFFPDKKQYDSGFERKHRSKMATPEPFKADKFTHMTEQQAREMALYILIDKEPKWHFKFDIPWIRKYDTPEFKAEAQHKGYIPRMRDAAKNLPKRITQFDEYRKRYLDADGFIAGNV